MDELKNNIDNLFEAYMSELIDILSETYIPPKEDGNKNISETDNTW